MPDSGNVDAGLSARHEPDMEGSLDTQFGQYIKPGEAWFSFHCPTVMGGMEDCEVKGYVALKNCTGLPTEDEEEE